ncbi:prephenate dehydratase [Elizabethkingia argentiflava]|uniref:Bifunctional chorismate mutase/prephenate dehydratase n=1 Tax=Elizabethkingia argenteiflava TaxID=2681556 RepID=A0A845Q090_9FLAO|nr:prephenate dehydratase [Elizabethkingia argenteiflava]NAW51740.1 prephenate dehydratase [Elizabethkingia argenteiflava]
MKIAFLGPHASFTQLAATQIFPDQQLIPQFSILDCFLAVKSNLVDKAVIPLENSIEGTVSMTLDYLYDTPQLTIEAEAIMPIAHQLMIHPLQHNHNTLEKIYSHPQALAQSFHFLNTNYAGTPLQDYASTAAAAKKVSETPEQKIAAVANSFAAKLYGLKIINHNIQDFEQNHTRFIVISKKKVKWNAVLKKVGEKTSILVTLPEDYAGGLHQVLSVFAWRKLNLSKIESRTLKKGLGKYFFFINIDGPQREVLIKNSFEELKSIGVDVKPLGHYAEYILES